jgi:flagellar assembly protein FliH
VVTRGRVLRASASATGVPPAPPTPRLDPGHAGRRVARVEVEARARAARIVAAAEARAEAIRRDAAARAAEEARAEEQAKAAAMYMALRAREERRAERELGRTVELAVLLAERLLGASLEARPELVMDLARQALAEARGARRARIEAHPLDADALVTHLEELGLSEGTAEVVPNPELSRGSLLLHTDLGTLDAKLAPQLDRLAEALRDALRPAS